MAQVNDASPRDGANGRPNHTLVEIARQPGAVELYRAGYPAELPPAQFTPRFVLYAARMWWKVALPVAMLLGAVAAGVVYYLFEPEFMASSLLRIEESAPYIAYSSQGDSEHRFVQTQIGIMKSRLVLGPVVKEINTLPLIAKQKDPYGWLERRLVVRGGGSELYTVAIQTSDPEVSAKVVNAVTGQFLKHHQDSQMQHTGRILELLERERFNRRDEVDRLQKQLKEAAKQASGKSAVLAGGGDLLGGTPLTELQRQLASAQVERKIVEATIQAAEEAVKGKREVPRTMLERAIEDHAVVREIKEQILANRMQLEKTKTAFRTAEGPFYRREVSQMETKIKEGEESLAKARASVRDQVKSELETGLDQTRQDEVAALQSRLEGLRFSEKFLREQYVEEQKKAEESGGENMELRYLQNDLAESEAVLKQITQRLTQLRTEQRAPERVSLLVAAEPPVEPIEVIPLRKMGLASLAAFCVPFALAVLWERLVRRVGDVDQLQRESHMAVVGEITRLPVRGAVAATASSTRMGHDLRLFEESVNSLTMNLLLNEDLRETRVLAVTSAVNHEGKTSVAAQLAVSLARASGQQTLLIDGDMRSPDIHRLFDVPLGPGLAGVLSGECTLDEAIVTQWSGFVHLLPAGELRASPYKLLANGTARSIIEEARGRYRFVVIDTPPVLAAAEALALAKAADGTLVCVMRNVSRGDQVRRACERLVIAGSRPVGTVLSGISSREYGYRYGRYYQVHN